LVTARLLAVGQRFEPPFHSDSFLLYQPIIGAVPLGEWLASAADRSDRETVLHEAAPAALHRIHQAGYTLRCHPCSVLAVKECAHGKRQIVVGSVQGFQRSRRALSRRVQQAIARDMALLGSWGEREGRLVTR